MSYKNLKNQLEKLKYPTEIWIRVPDTTFRKNGISVPVIGDTHYLGYCSSFNAAMSGANASMMRINFLSNGKVQTDPPSNTTPKPSR